jgi:hypothetical protein
MSSTKASASSSSSHSRDTHRERSKSGGSKDSHVSSNDKDANSTEKVAVSSPVVTGANTMRRTTNSKDSTTSSDDGASVPEEALSFDQYEKLFRSKALKKDSLPDLVTFPTDDVKVEEEKRKRRTVEAVIPVCTHCCVNFHFGTPNRTRTSSPGVASSFFFFCGF